MTQSVDAPTVPIVVGLRATDSLTEAGLRSLLAEDASSALIEGGEAQVVIFAAHRLDSRVVPALRRCAAGTGRPVVLLLDEIHETELLLAVECGVQAVLPRAAVTAELLRRTVAAVAGGAGMLPPSLVGELLDHLRRMHQQVLDEAGLNAAGLTPREVEVVGLIANGLETSEIARTLHCSERTVKGVIHGITRRLQLRNRSHVVAHAMRYGVI